MSDEPDGYQAYMLRLWRARCKGQWQWRASIENPHTGEHQWFATLEQFFAFLSKQCARQVPDAPQVPGTEGTQERRSPSEP
jgi:hypothetical protein